MNLVRGLLIGLIALMLLLGFGGFMISPELRIERSIHIDAPVADVYRVVTDFQQFNAWSPWRDLDADATYEIGGTAGTVGSWFARKSAKPEVGNGKQTITSLDPNRSVTMRLEFDEQDPGDGFFTLASGPNGTDVIWGYTADLGVNPYLRYFSFFADRFFGPPYEKGLTRLKKYIETGSAT